MFEAALQGLQNLLSLTVLIGMLAGIGVGTFTAITPQGLGTPLMYALFLSVVTQWDPLVAIAFLIGMDAVSSTCSAYLPVLFGIPGGAGSQATVMDGYPMGRGGQARRALGAAFTAGILGSLVGTATLAAAIPVAQALILFLGSPELFVVALWGVSMVSVLAGPRPLKGLMAGAAGLVISVVGIQPQSGVMRFVFDQPYLLEGVPLAVATLALFGVPSALEMALAKVGVEREPAPLAGRLLDGIRDAFHNVWLVVRCSFLGVWVGIVPGLGAQVVDWLSYGHAAQTCKGAKETFGKGDVRGVIAPEASNDAKDGGTLIPTLTLGVPGSLVSALFLFALTTMGFAPGPFMLERNADVVYSIIWVLGIASVIGGSLGLVFSNQLARLAELRYSIIVPAILGFVLIGALNANQSPLDLVTVVSFGFVGYFMKRFGYPRPPLILGMILGIIMEKYLYISTARYGFDWLGRPSVLVLLILVAGTLGYTLWSRRERLAPGDEPAGESAPASFRVNWETLLVLGFLAFFLLAIRIGFEWPFIAKLMPVYIAAVPGAALALWQLFRVTTGREPAAVGGVEMDESFSGDLDAASERRRTVAFFAWFVGAALAVWLLGITLAVPLFVFLYCLVEGRERLWVAVLMAAIAFLLVWGLFEGVFKVLWAEGVLFGG
ncbi:MAG: tripartite tricarboxylate transporter permease [Deltaproteobacteria bacterium]|nr:tripartite tricarboxylate transporter permease [Deltaproteobacteria bacterium]